MAFQTGTKVDPRLMRADLSGFSRGTELAMAGIASAVSGYAKKKKEKEQNKLAAEAFVGAAENNPYLRGLFPEGELTTESVLPTVKAMGAKNMMSLMMQTNLLQTKAAVEGQSLESARERLGGFTDAIKDLGMKVVRGELQFIEKPIGGKKKITYEDTLNNPQLQKIFNLYQEEAQSIFPGQFNAPTGFEPSRERGGQNRYVPANFATGDYSFEGIEGGEYLNP
jgi:hypothetical protein